MTRYLQKAMMPARERGWIAFGEETVCGYVVDAAEVAWATTPEQLFRVHGLGFPGSPLSPDLDFLDIVRIPLGPFVRVVPAMGGNAPSPAAAMFGPFIDHPPFTGNGFVGGVSESVVPLWWLDPIRVPAGTELRRVHRDGRDELLAVYGNIASGWVPQGGLAIQREGWLAPSETLGTFGTWNAQRVFVDVLQDGRAVVASIVPLPGLHLVERGIYAATVPLAEVGDVAAVRFTCTWRGEPFQITHRFASAESVSARLVYLGRDSLRAEALGLMKTDAAVYEASADWAELADVQAIELTTA